MVDRYLRRIIESGLDDDAYEQNFADAYPPLDSHEAMVAADRCYFCYDAPCMTACPTAIDIRTIRQISTGNLDGSARTIFEQNILGGMCARVCPTETLCEQACVREEAEGKPSRSACCSVTPPIMRCGTAASISTVPPLPARALPWSVPARPDWPARISWR